MKKDKDFHKIMDKLENNPEWINLDEFPSHELINNIISATKEVMGEKAKNLIHNIKPNQ